MLVKTQAIVLRNINYSETSVISKMYTRELGLRSYLINAVRKPKAKISMATLQPLNLLEMEVYDKANANLQRVKEVKCAPLLVKISQDFRRRSVAMFMVELLHACLLDEEGDQHLFDFLRQQILLLEEGKEISNFPILFMLALGKKLGIEPQGKYSDDMPFFDLQMATFVSVANETCMSRELSQALYLFILAENSHEHITVDGKIRREVLNQLTLYYQLHIMKNREMNSIKVLTEVMDAWHGV